VTTAQGVMDFVQRGQRALVEFCDAQLAQHESFRGQYQVTSDTRGDWSLSTACAKVEQAHTLAAGHLPVTLRAKKPTRATANDQQFVLHIALLFRFASAVPLMLPVERSHSP
jgi:hypothetical protein